MANAQLHTRLLQCRYHGVAPSTRCTYQSGIKAFITFCARFNISPLPTSSLTLQYFCAEISQTISYKTLKVYLAAIRLLHIEHDLPDPTDDSLLELVCRGIHRQQGDNPRPRLPITINHLRTLKNQLRISQYSLLEQRMLWSSFTLAFYGFLRISKYTSLQWSDVTVSGSEISIKLHQSKTDPFRHGYVVSLHASNSSTCPLRAFQLYSAMTPNKSPSSPVFSAGRFSPLTRTKLNNVLRHLLQQAGVNHAHYTSHSFRIGAATTAAAAGLPSWLIQKLGRWTSNTYTSYIHCPTISTSSISRILSCTDATNQPTWSADQ